ncbi:PIN domain-containing protein [bacterium]|nr:PIN domain-containing protein [bacterium]
MSVVLLDTTVASLLHPKKKGTEIREKYAIHMKDQTLALSFQSVAELWQWSEANGWEEKSRQMLDIFIRRFLVIPYDYELAQVWANVMEQSRKEGRRFEAGDCWIASTAVHRNIPLLTHDRDFVGRAVIGLNVITYVGEVT